MIDYHESGMNHSDEHLLRDSPDYNINQTSADTERSTIREPPDIALDEELGDYHA